MCCFFHDLWRKVHYAQNNDIEVDVNTHPYVKLAIQAVKHFLLEGAPLPCPSPVPCEMKHQSGAFISIKKKEGGQLRGCVGTVTPSQDNLAKEIIRNAVKAATHDPRFKAVTKEELNQLLFSVDILSPLEAIDSPEQLNPKKYGLSIKHKNQQGVILPDLQGIDTVQRQIELCLKKGNIPKDAPYQMYRFEVERHH